MIQIINGAVGVKVGKRTVLKNREDGPLSLDKKTETRLVSLGFAEWVGKNAATSNDDVANASQDVAAVKLDKANRATLVQEAANRGIEVADGATKKEILVLIEQYDAAQNIELDDGEDAGDDAISGEEALEAGDIDEAGTDGLEDDDAEDDGEDAPVITAAEVE